jgi:hypothetical protein
MDAARVDKQIHVQVVTMTDPGYDRCEPQPHTINASHTLQQAVLQAYTNFRSKIISPE